MDPPAKREDDREEREGGKRGGYKKIDRMIREAWNGRMDNGRIVRRSRRMTGEFEMRYT